MAYVYCHIKADDGEPFYVGMGKTKTRPWNMSARSDWHKNIVSKHGVRVEIIIDEIDWDSALWWEVRWIKALKSSGYNLVNLTDGGEDQPMRNPITREKIRIAMTGKKLTAKTKEKIRLANIGKKLSEEQKISLRGRKLSKETIDKMKKYRNTLEGRENCAKGHRGKEPHNKGKTLSEEQKEKLKIAWVRRKTYPISDELREKGRAAAMKRWHPDKV